MGAPERLRILVRVWVAAGAMSRPQNEATARAWFIGGNPFLDEETPITALREDRHKEAAQALTAFLEDRQDV